MNVTIAYNIKSEKTLSLLEGADRICFKATSLKEAYIYHIEHVNVDSYLIETDGMSEKELMSIIEHVKYLNAIITILLYKPAFKLPEVLSEDKYIRVIENDADITRSLNQISSVSRETNRVEWPLLVEFWKLHNKKGSLKREKVLSLSASGCFIKTDKYNSLEIGDTIAMLFSFTYFDFYSDGTVVRIVNDKNAVPGIAVEFKDVSKQTQKCIKEIIDERILSKIMDAIN